jgi:hypothetical protein
MRRLLAAALLLVACERPATPAAGGDAAPVGTARAAHVVRDSAGVTVVESSAPAWGDRAGWRVEAEPRWAVGGVAGDPMRDLAGVRSGTRLPDGTVVVANGATGELRLFGPDGTPRRALGGRGTGDGRFAALARVFARGDTLVAWDERRQALTRFLPDGTLLGVERVLVRDTTRLSRVLGVFGDGSLLAAVAEPVDVATVPGPVVRVATTLYRVRGDRSDSLLTVPGEELVVRRARQGTAAMLRPFGLATRALVRDDGIVVGEGERHAFRRYDTDGRLVAVYRRAGPRLPLVAEDTARERSVRAGAARTAREREQLDALWRTLPFPDSLPAHGELVEDAAGGFWTRDVTHAADSTSRWQAYAADGAWLGAIALPPRTAPLAIGPDWVLARRVDSEGVEFVQLHALAR